MKKLILLSLLSIEGFAHADFQNKNEQCVTIKTSCDRNPESSTCAKQLCGVEKVQQYDQPYLNHWTSEQKLVGQVILNKEEFLLNIKKTIPALFKNFSIRIIENNSVVTQDYRVDRINIYLDENKKIKSVLIG